MTAWSWFEITFGKPIFGDDTLYLFNCGPIPGINSSTQKIPSPKVKSVQPKGVIKISQRKNERDVEEEVPTFFTSYSSSFCKLEEELREVEAKRNNDPSDGQRCPVQMVKTQVEQKRFYICPNVQSGEDRVKKNKL